MCQWAVQDRLERVVTWLHAGGNEGVNAALQLANAELRKQFPDAPALTAQRTHDMPAKEAGAAEHGDDFAGHAILAEKGVQVGGIDQNRPGKSMRRGGAGSVVVAARRAGWQRCRVDGGGG